MNTSVFKSNAVKLYSKDGTKSSYVFLDDAGSITQSHVNSADPKIVPTLFDTTQPFDFSLTSPSVTNSVMEVGTSYVNVCLAFDANIGSSSTMISLNGGTIGSIVMSGNCLLFSYSNNNTSDTLEVLSYSADNSKSQKFRIGITLNTVFDLPTSWVVAPNTRQYAYTALQMNFSRPVTAFTSVVSTSGTISSAVVSGGKIQFNYTTGILATDTITFNGVTDGINPNTSAVTFNVTGLLVGPAFSAFTSAPVSQSYTYSGVNKLEAVFSKSIQSCSGISVSSGSPPTNIVIGAGNVQFDWTSPASASITLTFNGLVSTDGTLDGGSVETAVVTLSAPPSTPTWFQNQPILGNAPYTAIQVAFNKTIASVGSVFSSGTNQPTSVSIVSGRIQFNITTDANPGVTYTFSNIVAVDGGRLGSATLTTGPSPTAFLSNGLTAVGNKLQIQAAAQTVAITFSKTISNTPTATLRGGGTASYVSGSGTATIVWNLFNVVAGTTHLDLGGVVASDSTSTTGMSFVLSPVVAQTLVRLAERSTEGVAKTTFDAGTAYSLSAIFGKDVSADLTGVTVTASAGANPTALTKGDHFDYHFNWTPNTAGTIALNYNNTRDVDAFVRTLYQSLSLTVIGGPQAAFFPFPQSSGNYFNVPGTATPSSYEISFRASTLSVTWSLFGNNAGGPVWIFQNPKLWLANSTYTEVNAGAPVANVWYHFFVRTVANELYLNGVKQSYVSDIQTNQFTNIGRQNGTDGRQFVGDMYNVRYWNNDVRTGATAYAERNAVLAPGTTGLYGQWTLDGNTLDTSGNSNHLTWVNSTPLTYSFR
jgi:hypothetical protein